MKKKNKKRKMKKKNKKGKAILCSAALEYKMAGKAAVSYTHLTLPTMAVV